MAKTTTKATTTKATPAKRALGKSGKKGAIASPSSNGTRNGRVSEKTKRRTLRAFQSAYQQHALRAAAETQTVQPTPDVAATNTKRNGARPKRKKPSVEEITLQAFRKVYESHHPKTA